MSDDINTLPVDELSPFEDEDYNYLQPIFETKSVFKNQGQVKTFVKDIKETLVACVLFILFLFFQNVITNGIQRMGAKSIYTEKAILTVIFGLLFYIIQHRCKCDNNTF